MKYAYITNERIVHEVIPAFSDDFPGIPITERYAKDFLSRCLEVDDSVDVQAGMKYFPLENKFAFLEDKSEEVNPEQTEQN